MCSCSQSCDRTPVLLPHKPSGLPTCAPGRSQCLNQMPEKRCSDAMLGNETRACIASGTLLPSFRPSLHTPLLLRIGTVLTRLQLPVGQQSIVLVCFQRCCSCGVARTAVCSCSAPNLGVAAECQHLSQHAAPSYIIISTGDIVPWRLIRKNTATAAAHASGRAVRISLRRATAF